MSKDRRQGQLRQYASNALDTLESRVLLSASAAAHGRLTWDAVAAGKLTGSGTRLDLVVLHELGHALGLAHSSDSHSIMYAYYNANYNLNNFSSDSAVATLRSLYSSVSSSPWRDALDPKPGDNQVEITYSYMPDGTSLDKGSSKLFSTLDADMGRSTWQNIFTSDLSRWAGVSNGKISFLSHADAGKSFNFAGNVQNDPSAGDIRFGAHRFDGPGKVLAHTYYPPPNNSGTAAGDLHIDYAENWIATASPLAAAASSTTQPGPAPLHGASAGVRFSGVGIDFVPIDDATPV
jgi:hypothetical protein